MSRFMRAVAEVWLGSTNIIVETIEAVALLRGIAETGGNSDLSAVVDDSETTDLTLYTGAADHLLDLLDKPEELRAAADAVIAEYELDVEIEDVSALLGNLHIDRAAYREAYARDGSALRFRLDYS